MADQDETFSINLDGRQVEARKGEMIIAAAERAGTYIPRFCYHPRMKPVGMCRMCLVEVKGPRGFSLQPACFVPVAPDQEIVTDSPKVKKAQDGVLEFLLINHPLDCPVCDKGGECPLQDQTLAYGPGETRMVEEKRHWEKPIPLSELVLIDRERCIQCARCTRFADEIAGDPLINFVNRGDSIEVNTFPDQPFASYFSGNTVQICPVGALLATPYRFKARPWDLEQVESTCTVCSVGCRVAVQSSTDRLTRYLGIDSDPVNQSWLCDKGRFSYEAVNSDNRLAAPAVRKGDEMVEASWAEALEAAATALDPPRRDTIGIIGGARLANEDAYAWAKLAKGVIGTDNVDCQLGDGLPAEVVLGLPRATIDDACSASAVVLLAPDLKEELPVLFLRLRHAAVEQKLPIIEIAPRATGMTEYASVHLGYRPGEVATAVAALLADSNPRDVGGVDPVALHTARRLLGADNVVVILGRPSLAESGELVAEAAAALAGIPGVRFLPALRRGNVHGALDMGLAPGILPGRVDLDGGREWFSQEWGVVPEQRGLDTAGILQAAAAGRIKTLLLLGADPLNDFPDRHLAKTALEAVETVIAVDCFDTASLAEADIVLPAATFAERPGTTTNLEGRVTRLGHKITAPGVSWPDWMIAAELAFRLGSDLGFDNLDSITDEIARLAPSHAGITRELLGQRRFRDGVVAPLGAGSAGPVPGTGRPGGGPAIEARSQAVGAGSSQPVPAPIDPMSTPGLLAMEVHQMPAMDTAPDRPGGAGEGEAEAAADAGASEDTAEEAVAEDPAVTAVNAAEAARDARPALLSIEPGSISAERPRDDAYSLRLIATRKLYDNGTIVQESQHLATIPTAGQVALHPTELARLGLDRGGPLRLISARASMVVDAVPDAGVPRGAVAMTFNLPGEGAGDVIDATHPVTDVRVETV